MKATAVRDTTVARRALGTLVLALAVVTAYLPAIMGGGFVWDDDYNLTANPAMRDLAGIARIWTENTVPPWYPLYHTALWIEFQAFGESALGYHVVNVLLHALNALLLWRLLDRLSLRGAWLAAAVWALHPVQVESVAWVTELKNVLSATFYLAAATLWCAAELRARPGERRDRFSQVPALVLFAAALLTKTVTATLPVALLLIVWWKRGSVGARAVSRLAPWFVLALVLGVVTVWQEKALGASGADWAASPVARALVAGRALWFYAAKLAWPDPILFVYPRWTIEASSPLAWLYPAAAAAVLLALWVFRARIGRGPFAAAAYFALTLAPALGFFDVFYTRYAQVADRWQYLASAGLIVLAASAVARLGDGVGPMTRAAAMLPPLAVLALLGASTWRETRHYADAETLWRATLAENPQAFAAHNNLGALLLRRGETDAAERHFRAACEAAPDFPDARNNLGIVLQGRGRLAEAIEQFEIAIRSRPGFADALNNLGIALASAGRLADAEASFRQAVAAGPDLVSARRNLGVLLLELGRPAEAAEQFRAMASLAPDLTEARLRLAETAEALGDAREAIAAYREVLTLEPDSADAALGLGWLLATVAEPELRDGAAAERLAETVLDRRGPRDARAWDVLGAARAESGRFEPAIEAAERAAALAAEAGAARYAGEIEERRRRYERREPWRTIRAGDDGEP